MNAAFVDDTDPIESKDVPPLEKGTASDNCDHDVSINVSELKQQTYSNCDNAYNLVRSWTARDGRGNEDSKTRTLAIIDTTPPIAPAEKAYCVFRDGVQSSEICEKDSELIAAGTFDGDMEWVMFNLFDATGYHNFADDCGEASTTYCNKATTTVLTSCEGPVPCRYDDKSGEIGLFADTRQGEVRDGNTRTYTATILQTDVCGNIVSSKQTFEVTDIASEMPSKEPSKIPSKEVSLISMTIT